MKISIVGLSNAGKTSILRVITNQFETLDNLKPTIGIDIKKLDFFGKNITFWDFGGQVSYITKYLTSPQRYFKMIDILFYVVDTQDISLINENETYFRSIYHNVQKFSPKCRIIIICNKLDPNIETKEIKDYKKRILEIIYNIDKDTNLIHKTYYTSIFAPMTIFTAFSESLFNKDTIKGDMSEFLKGISADYNFEFAFIFSTFLFDFGKHISEGINSAKIEHFLHSYFMKFKEYNDNLEIDIYFEEFQVLHSKFLVQINNKREIFFLLIGFYPERTLLKKGDLSSYLHQISQDLGKYITASFF